MGCSVSHGRRKEKAGHAWWMLVAGKGLGEDVTNRAAARPVAAVRDKTKGGDSQRERERGRRNRDEPEALSRELSMSRAPASLPPRAGAWSHSEPSQ